MSMPRACEAASVQDEVGGGDQGLARHAVGEHGRPADAAVVDQGDLGTQLPATRAAS
jgi:hypothetical protein